MDRGGDRVFTGPTSGQVTRSAVPELDDLMAELTSGDEALAEAVVKPLLALGEGAIPALLDLMKAEDADQRWWAIRTLSQSPHVKIEWLLPSLSDPDVAVRQAVALGLCSLPGEAAIPSLIQALSDPDSLVSSLAMHALIVNGKAAVPALMEVPSDAQLAVRINVLRALAEIQDHQAIPMFMSALEEESALLQHWAEEGLNRLGLNMIYMKPE